MKRIQLVASHQMQPSLKMNLLHYVTVIRTNVIADKQAWEFAARIRKELQPPTQQGAANSQDDDEDVNGFTVRRRFAWGNIQMPIEVNNIENMTDQFNLTSQLESMSSNNLASMLAMRRRDRTAAKTFGSLRYVPLP